MHKKSLDSMKILLEQQFESLLIEINIIKKSITNIEDEIINKNKLYSSLKTINYNKIYLLKLKENNLFKIKNEISNLEVQKKYMNFKLNEQFKNLQNLKIEIKKMDILIEKENKKNLEIEKKKEYNEVQDIYISMHYRKNH